MSDPIDPLNMLKKSDPGRSLSPLEEPWRLREKILVDNSASNVGNQTTELTRRDRVKQIVGAFGIAAGVWGLVAVSGGSALPTIALAGGGRAGAEGAPAANGTADGKMAIWAPVNYEFVLDDGVDIPAGKEKVYRWVGPTEDDVRVLAAKLGVVGDITPLPADQGDGWQIGDQTATTEGSTYFVVYSTGSFAYYPSAVKSPPFECVEPGSRGSGGGANDSGRTAPDGASSTPCEYNPVPTKNLPSKADAEAKLQEMFGELTDINIYVDPFAVYASGAMTSSVDGLGDAGKQWVSLTFGENGAIVDAFGMLGQLEEVGSYPTISASDAVERLSQGFFGGIASGPSVRVSGGGVAADAGVDSSNGSRDVVTSDSVLVDPIPVPSESVPVPDVTIETFPVKTLPPVPTVPASPSTTVPVETVTVRLVKVTVVYQQLWDAKGVMWVVPSYQYTDSNGGLWTSYAVNGKYFDLPETPIAVMNEMMVK